LQIVEGDAPYHLCGANIWKPRLIQ